MADASRPIYGPFHRVQSPTQSDEVAALQVQSQEMWGRARRGSDIPQVQAYAGPLPDGTKGIQFETHVKPDGGLPPGQARWTGPREGVTVKDDFARIPVKIVKNTQTSALETTKPETEIVTIKDASGEVSVKVLKTEQSTAPVGSSAAETKAEVAEEAEALAAA